MGDTTSYKFRFQGGITRRGTIMRIRPDISGSVPDWFRYDLNDNNLVLPLGRDITPEMADLLDVCLAIAMCDRRAPRPRNVGRRVIDVSIPVRCPELWKRREVRLAVIRLVEKLTGDMWIIHFERREHGPRQVAAQLSCLDPVPEVENAVVVLHSGGLDSLLGMAEILDANERATVVPVSVITNSKTLRVINVVTESLQRAFPDALVRGSYLRLVHRRINDIDDREGTYRARILPCLAAGVAVAAGVSSGRLQLTENGPGAINLTTSAEQLDAWTTRATHPRTLADFADFATLVVDQEILIMNTGLLKTKGQLAAVLHDSRFEEAARLTVSCERFPYANANTPCGTCMSCLYREMALYRAGLSHLDADRNSRRKEMLAGGSGQKSGIASSALALHLAQLRELLETADPYRELDAEYERIDEVLQVAEGSGVPRDELKSAIVALFRAFVAEGDAILRKNVDTFSRPQRYAHAS